MLRLCHSALMLLWRDVVITALDIIIAVCGHVASAPVVFAMCCNGVHVTVVLAVCDDVVLASIDLERCGYNRACCR